jgi:hypothetical protein
MKTNLWMFRKLYRKSTGRRKKEMNETIKSLIELNKELSILESEINKQNYRLLKMLKRVNPQKAKELEIKYKNLTLAQVK